MPNAADANYRIFFCENRLSQPFRLSGLFSFFLTKAGFEPRTVDSGVCSATTYCMYTTVHIATTI